MTHPPTDTARAEFIFRAFFDQAAVGVAVVDSASAQVVTCNDRFCAILGLDPATAAGTLLGTLEHPDDQHLHRAAVAAIERGETDRYVVEKRYRHADGAVVWARVMTSAIAPPRSAASATPEAGWHVAIVEDITDRKQYEQALQHREAWYRSLWDTTPDAVVTVGADNLIRSANPGVQRVFGHTPLDLVGRDAGVLQPERLREAHRAGMARYLATGVRRVDWRGTEVTGLRKDGSEFPLEVSFSHASVAGEEFFVAFMRDISERKRAEQVLRQSEERLALALAAGQLGHWDWSVAADELDWSDTAKAMFGLAPASVVTLPRFLEIVHPEDRTRVQQAVETALDTGHNYDVEFRVVWPDGTQRWIQAIGKPQPNPGGRSERMTGLVQDVTERVEREAERHALEEKLRRAETLQALGTFAGGIAHDFNNMLSAVMGNVALARQALQAGEPAQGALDQIDIAARRARSLVKEILAFSRNEPARQVTLALQPLVEETVQLLRAGLPAGVTISAQLCATPMLVRADPGQMQRVLMNLCTNASQAMRGAAGRILLTLEIIGPLPHAAPGAAPLGHAVLRVADDGVGMTPDVRQRLFEPFFTTKASSGGTGLGLSVVHGIVAAHGGSIDVRSEPGHGTVFELQLPLAGAEATDAVPEAPSQVLAGIPWDDIRHVLYVDDDEVVSLMVGRLLERNGLAVRCVPDTQEALRLAADPAEPIDLLLTDFDMPAMTGIELAVEVRRLRPTLRIVVSSGTIDTDLQEHARITGGWPVVQKDELVQALGSRLKNRRR
ncbi:hybrid sensor histidine kinase/response regulator [Ideonella sp. BN130291]|uniref:hybrid sensor histidine kinase/response regulator n=1 Tax=Ideonella sp. BN130291 TaxID=3112940 RepID=UPI002E26EA54|nr:PAS domain S-box protein [Ideonella sp. BN130291]